MTSRRLEDEFDPTFEGADKHLGNVENILKTKDAYIQKTKEEQGELSLLIQRLDERSSAAKQSRDLICAEFSGAGPATFGQPSMSADFDMPDYDEHHDDLVLRQCLQAHNERAETIGNASGRHETLKQQVADFKGKLQQLRTDLSTQVKQVHEHLRLEYEGRLSQQRRELDEKAQSRKAKFNKELEEKQKVIDEMTAKSYLSHRTEVEDANAVMGELSAKLAAAETAKGKAVSDLSIANEQLEMAVGSKDKWKTYAQSIYKRNEELSGRLERAEKRSSSNIDFLGRKLDETTRKLTDTAHKAKDTERTLAEAITSGTRIGKQLDASQSDYATLLKDVVLVQKQKLCNARSQKILLNGYLVGAKSTVDSLHTKLDAKFGQVERRNQQLTQKNDLLKSRNNCIEELQRQLTSNKQSLQRKNRTISDDTTRIRGLEMTNLELEAQLKTKSGLLASTNAEIAGKTQENKHLERKASKAAEELTSQRSLVTQKAQRIHGLENTVKELDATIARLDSDLGGKESELRANASAINLRGQQIQKLKRAIREVQKEKKNICMAMRSLEDSHLDLKLNLSTRNSELTSQIALVAQKGATIRDLEASVTNLSQEQTAYKRDKDSLETEISSLQSEVLTKTKMLATEASTVVSKDARIKEIEAINTSLSQAQTAAESSMDILGTRLSNLTIEVKAKTEELGSHKAAAALKDERIQALEVTNAVLLRSQGDAQRENANLQSDLETVNGRIATLEATFKAQGVELLAANEASERNRRQLEKVEKDVLRAQEEAENEKVCFQNRLAAADIKVDNLEAQLTLRDSELRKSNEETEHTCQRLAKTEKELSAEKIANAMASLEIKTINDKIQILSTDLDDSRKRLKKEEFKSHSLVTKVGQLEEEQSKAFEEKMNCDRDKIALGERLSCQQDTMRNLEADVASKSTLLDQLQTDCTLYLAERTCLLDQLLAESVRSSYVANELPNIIANPIGDGRDVRMFQAMQAGEVVLVRAQRFLREHKALIIVGKIDHTRLVWHDSLEKCRVSLVEWQWCLCVEKRPNEVAIELNIGDADPQGLGYWLKGSDRGSASLNT